MGAPIWSYYAFAAVVFVAVLSQDSASGKFTITLTIQEGLADDEGNGWKLWCSSLFGNSCKKTGRDQRTTGHDTITVPAARRAMEAIETCYTFCMEQFPPTAERSDTYPFGQADITSYSCSEAFNASVCLSACLHHDHENTLAVFRTILGNFPEARPTCKQWCRQSRGVCDRAFAPNTSQENNECHQNCLSGTICEDMCNATSTLPSSTDGTGRRVPSNILDETYPYIKRPQNNRILWEDGVLEFTQGTIIENPNRKTSQVYGLLWKLQDIKDKDKQYYMAHHMTFFYLPDEVKYHRLPARYFSLPKAFECTRFKVVTAAVRALSTSDFSEPEFVCTPGLSVPDPPTDVSVTSTFTNYTVLEQLTFNFVHSRESGYCDNYVAKISTGEHMDYITRNISTDARTISLTGEDLFVGSKSILDTIVTLSFACVTWSNTHGLDPYNWPVQTVFRSKVSLRALTYCGSHINNPSLVVAATSDPDTGLWSLNLTFRITAEQVSPQMFLYLGAQEGQSIVYNVTGALPSFTVPLKVGVFRYEQIVKYISPGTRTISGEVEESAQFTTELMRAHCPTCCRFEGTRDFRRTITLEDIHPSPPSNVSLAAQLLNTVASVRVLSITLRVLPPQHSAGTIVGFKLRFGGAKVPILFETYFPYNDTGSKNETILLHFEVDFHEDIDDRWDFLVAAVSNFSVQSKWFNFSMPSPYPTPQDSTPPDVTQEDSEDVKILAGILSSVGVLLLITLVLIALCIGVLYRHEKRKAVSAPKIWFGNRTDDTQEEKKDIDT